MKKNTIVSIKTKRVTCQVLKTMILFLKEIRSKAKLIGKRSGRKSTWHEEIKNDLVDVVCKEEYLRKKIIFTNNKNTKNTEVYNKVVRHL